VSDAATVVATYSVGAPGMGTLTVSASGANASDGGWVTVPVQSFGVAVTPDGGAAPTRVPNTGGYTAVFTVQNTGSGSESFTFACTGAANVTCGTVGPSSATLASTASTTVTVSYSVGTAGTASLSLTATGSSGFSSDGGSYTVLVGQAAGAPIVDVAPYNYGKQDYSRCAVSCFATVYVQSTVPYLSLDTPRSVTLVYNSDRVNPRPFVHVNVTPDLSLGTPLEYQLQVKVNNAFVTFVNGDQTLRFMYPGSGKVRLGGQFDAAAANAGPTGVYPLDIIVSALYAAPTGLVTTSIPTKLVIVNETTAPVAAGWTLAGIQRLYLQGDGSAIITEGDGNAVYFWNVGGTFVAPAGEFSSLAQTTQTGARWARSYVDGSQAVFDSAGRMIRLLDRFANTTTIAYDASSRVVRITDPAGLRDTLVYGTNGVASITDPGSPARTTAVTVDASRRVTAITDPDNVSTRFVFDATVQLWKVLNRRGDSTTFGYDTPSRKLTFITFPRARLVLASGADSTVSPTESHYPWQTLGVPYTSTTGTAATPVSIDSVTARIVDARGFATTFTVNPWGSPVRTTDALGGVTTVSYDANGLPVRTAYPTGGVDTVAYNANGLPTFVQPAGLSAVTIHYGGYGQPDSVAGTGRPTVRNILGFSGTVDQTILGGQDTTRFTYDSRGRVLSTTDPQGHLLGQHTYAGTNGNLSKDSLPGNRVTTYFADSYGRDTAVQAPGVARRRVVYDALNRAIQVFDGVNPNPTATVYDSLFVRNVTDPKGQVYGFTYNALGWLTQRTDPAGRALLYAYDKNGNLKRWTNRRADTLTYGYDGLNRPTSKSGRNTASESWSYSTDRRVLTNTSPVDTETVYLNVAGQPDSIRTKLAGQTYWRRYRYTTAGLRDSLDVSGGGIVFKSRKWIWNSAFGTLSELHVGGAVTSIARNKDLQDTSVTFPSGDRVSRQYYPLHNVTQISTTAAYNSTIARSIGFDTHGRISEQAVGDGSMADQYTYDGIGRLTSDSTMQNVAPSSTCDGNPPPIVDPNGNSCITAGGWQATAGTKLAYDAASNDTANGGSFLTGNRITAFGGCSYVTDNDGNVTSRTCSGQTVTFTWTAESRLASYTVGGQTIALQYDAAGWLVRKDVNGAPQSHFVWDGDNLLAELTSTGTGLVAEYSYYGPDQLHALFVGGTEYNAHADGLGNVIALTDGAQTVKRTYGYTAWGQSAGGSDLRPFTNADRARFKGALWLGPEVDLYYMRARWYEPQSGRFLSEDPVGLEGGLNAYVYTSDDPVNSSDPLGLDEEPLEPPSPCEGAVDVLACLTGDWGGGGGGGGSGADSFGFGLGGGGGGNPGQQPKANQPGPQPQQCVGRARVLGGNPRSVGRQGGFPGVRVAAGSAAIIPQQFGGLPKSSLAPYLGQISGSVGGRVIFAGVTDVIGGTSPIPGMNVRDALQLLNPGTFIVELVTGTDLGVVNISLSVPEPLSCPTGTARP